MTEVLPKIAEIHAAAPQLPISIDGGITLDTAPRCAAQGASLLIAGTALFRSPDMAGDIRRMRQTCLDVFPEVPTNHTVTHD